MQMTICSGNRDVDLKIRVWQKLYGSKRKEIGKGRICDWVMAKAQCSEYMQMQKTTYAARLFSTYRYYLPPNRKK